MHAYHFNPMHALHRERRRRSRRLAGTAVFQALAALIFLAASGFRQAVAQQDQIPADLGVSFLQERTKFVGTGTNPYFMMRGAKVDFSFSLARGLGLAVSGTGLSTVNLRGSLDQEQIALMAGPRYTWNWGHITPTATNRKGSLFVEGKAGYVIAIAGAFPVNGQVVDHASALTYLGGAGVNVHLYDRLDLRAINVEYVRSQLPNGGTNQQNSLRLGAGINFHFGL